MSHLWHLHRAPRLLCRFRHLALQSRDAQRTRLPTEGVISLSVSESRKEKLINEMTGALDFCSSDTARRLAGKLQFTLSWTFGRVGKAALQPLYARSHEPVRHKHRTDLALLRRTSEPFCS